MTYKDRIKEIMRRNNVTQIELAERLGKTVQNVRNTLSASNMTVSTLSDYAGAIGCNVADFFADESAQPANTFKCPVCGAELELKEKKHTTGQQAAVEL